MKKFFYWVISLTWGGLMTYIGLLVALVLIITGHKLYKFGHTFYFKFGKNWGGISLGAVIITDDTPTYHTLCHEHGHGLQNCVWGLLFPFVIGIPSGIRYQWYTYKMHKGIYNLPPYDSIWFEGQATKWGETLISKMH